MQSSRFIDFTIANANAGDLHVSCSLYRYKPVVDKALRFAYDLAIDLGLADLTTTKSTKPCH